MIIGAANKEKAKDKFKSDRSGKEAPFDPQKYMKRPRPKTTAALAQERIWREKGQESRRNKKLGDIASQVGLSYMGGGKSAIPPLRYEETVPLSTLPARTKPGVIVSTVASFFKRLEMGFGATLGFMMAAASTAWYLRTMRNDVLKPAYRYITKNRKRNKAKGWMSKYKGRIAVGIAAVGVAAGLGFAAKKYAENKEQEDYEKNMMPADMYTPQQTPQY